MSYTPVVRFRNFKLEHIKSILEVYPDMVKGFSRKEAWDEIESKFNGYKKTAYQYACQLGLECRVDEFKVQNYLYSFDDENLMKYLNFWFKMYVTPNPFVGSDEQPICIYLELANSILQAPNNEVGYEQFFNDHFGDGKSADILFNAIKDYGDPIKVLGDKIFIESEKISVLTEIIKKIEKTLPMANYKDEVEFFNRFSFERFCDFYDLIPSEITGVDLKSLSKAEELEKFPYNRIVFGAPGTGKSFRIEKQRLGFGGNYERVTFHPNYSYAQFVGTYKPKPKLKDEGTPREKEYISYEFVPGPFLRTLIKAKKDPKNKFLLIIEEINRANVAAVFGDVFQLLDRKTDGTSEYNVATSEEMRDYLVSQGFNRVDIETITIPNNMYIWATMNSADQGVSPMDSAFKRRWHFEYIGIDTGSSEISNKKIKLKPYGEIKWNSLRTRINDRLTEADLNVNEDKLIGPFFISNKELISSNIDEIFKSKLLMYLFEDVLKHRKGKLFKSELNTFSKIIDAYDAEENIFDFDFVDSDSPKEDIEFTANSEEQQE